MISMSTPADLARALGLPALAGFTEKDGFDRRGEISVIVAEGMAGLTAGEALDRLAAAGVWHELVRDYDSLRDNPQARHLGVFMDMQTQAGSAMTLLSHPIRYDGVLPAVRIVPQPLGGQTREVLAEAGFEDDEIESLLAAGAVAQTSRMRG